jgi:hypothetical protein
VRLPRHAGDPDEHATTAGIRTGQPAGTNNIGTATGTDKALVFQRDDRKENSFTVPQAAVA